MHQHRHTFSALGGSNEITLYAATREVARNVCTVLEAEVREIERRYSRYLPDSIITQINRSAGGEPVKVDDETAALIDYASVCFEQSDGLFDITSGVLRRAWNFKVARIPSPSELQEILPLINWRAVEWDRPFFRLPIAEMEIDFGGIGKEYASDRVASKAIALGIQHGMINLSGDVRVIGPHPDGIPWRIGVTHPRKPTEAIDVIALSIGAVATSGDYERFFEVDGTRYCHILNPKTGMPTQLLQSTTVISESCLVAGSASTIAMLRGVEFLEQLGLPYVVVDSKGEVARAVPSL